MQFSEISKETQVFKIGRMQYGVPSYVIKEGKKYLLDFWLNADNTWSGGYTPEDGGRGKIKVAIGSTFNNAVRETRKALKSA